MQVEHTFIPVEGSADSIALSLGEEAGPSKEPKSGRQVLMGSTVGVPLGTGREALHGWELGMPAVVVTGEITVEAPSQSAGCGPHPLPFSGCQWGHSLMPSPAQQRQRCGGSNVLCGAQGTGGLVSVLICPEGEVMGDTLRP